MFYTIPLPAGVEVLHTVPGRVFLVDSTGAASDITVTFNRDGSASKKVPGRKKAFKAIVEFDSISLLSTVDTTVSVFISFNEVDIGLDDGVHVFVDNADAAPVPVKTPAGQPLAVVQSVPWEVVNPAGQRLDVNIDGGTVNVTADNVGINNDDTAPVPVRNQALTTIVHAAAVSVGVVATSLGVADATLRKMIFRNDHATAVVALGGAGVTLANGPIVLQPGDIWEERDAPGIEWFAISDTAATSVQVMGMK